jgi:transcriptional regulator with XRE-family HTH domain
MLTPAQCKMARVAVGLGVRDLAARAQVSPSTVNRFELGQGTPIPATLAAIRRALEEAGIEFIPGGARLRDQPAEVKAS